MKKLKPVLLAVSSGAVTGAGLYCAVMFCIIVGWSNTDAHPIAFPGSLLGGISCLCSFFLLVFWYIRVCIAQGRRWLLLLDSAVYLGSVPVFFLFCMQVDKMLAMIV